MADQIPVQQQDTLARRGLDNDSVQYGVEGPFDDWSDDHTSLVHVLWHARHSGLTLDSDADEIARLIRASRWHAATKSRAAAGGAEQLSKEYRIVPRKAANRDKARTFASETEYRAVSKSFNTKDNRHESRAVGKWTEIHD